MISVETENTSVNHNVNPVVSDAVLRKRNCVNRKWAVSLAKLVFVWAFSTGDVFYFAAFRAAAIIRRGEFSLWEHF